MGRSERAAADRSGFDPAASRYVSLMTYRKSGATVATPVWIARAGERYYVFSEGKAGKIKRLRNNASVRLADCDIRGRVRGDWIDGRAHVTKDGDRIADAYAALRRKYGWSMRIGDMLSKLTGRFDRRAMIEIELV